MPKDAILLTGSTGFIGQYLLHNLLTRDREVAVLVRPKRNQTAKERVERRIRGWERRLKIRLPRPLCFEGDIRRDFFGLTSDEVSWVRQNVETMVHVAALVEFASRGTTIWDTNVIGTENCLKLCRAARIGQLHYVSTAYVCGDYSGTFYEDQLECGQEFRNEYEQSKFLSERMVRTGAAPDEVTVHRPAVVIGDSQTGFATSFRGFYVLAQFTHLIAQHAQRDADGRWHHPVRLNHTGDEKRNLIPVDWVAQVIDKVLNTPALWGRTYHIAPSVPVTTGQVEAALREYFRFYGVDLVGRKRFDVHNASEREEMFFDYIRTYMPYWDDDPHFDITNTQAAMDACLEPRVGVPELVRMIEFAVQNRFGKRARRRDLAAC